MIGAFTKAFTLFHDLSSMLPPYIEVAVNGVPQVESKPNTLQCSIMQSKITFLEHRRVAELDQLV